MIMKTQVFSVSTYATPEGFEFEKAMDRFANEIQQYGFEVKLGKVQPPHYVDKNDPFVQKLVTAYRNQTNDMTEPYTIGGGTYARNLDKGVAFGAMFSDSEDLMHQKNEYITKKQLFNATSILLRSNLFIILVKIIYGKNFFKW